MPDAPAHAAPAPVAAKPAPTVVPAQPAAKTPAPTEPKAASPASGETYEVTISGEKRQLSKNELIKLASKSGFADKVTQQAREGLRVIKEREAKLKEQESIWEDDEKLEAELKRRGKLDKLSLKRLQQKAEELQLTPEQQESQRLAAEKAELQKKLDERDEADKKAKGQQLAQQMKAQMESQLAAAAERAGLLSKDMPEQERADAFYAVYAAVKDAHRLGIPFDAERIVETAMEDIDNGFKRLEQSVTKNLKGAALKARLGPAVWKEVLRHAAEEFRNGGAPRPPPTNGIPKPQEQRQHLSPSDLTDKYRGAR